MALLPKVKLKTIVSFPAAVFGGAGIAVRKENGQFYFDLDFSKYPVVGAISSTDLPNTKVLTYNTSTSAYLLAPYGGGGSGGGIPDAPGDGTLYGRKSISGTMGWSPVPSFSAANTVTAIQGKLTLTSGFPVTEADVAGAITIYCTPSGGNSASIYDGTQWNTYPVGELALALDGNSGDTGYHQQDNNYDLFVINNAGTVQLVTGPSWLSGGGSAILRGTGTALFTLAGIPVNANTMTARFGSASANTVSVPAHCATYVGSFRATANGQATDSKSKRLLFNAYNAVERMLFIPGPPTHDYSVATSRAINNDPTNRVDVLVGLTGAFVHLEATNTIGNSTATYRTPANGLNLDGSGAAFGKWIGVSSASFACLDCFYDGYPGVGYHSYVWIEVGAGSDVQSWYQTGSVLAGSVLL